MKPLNVGHSQSATFGPLFGSIRYSEGLDCKKLVFVSKINVHYWEVIIIGRYPLLGGIRY